ncbi:MAG TPA: rhodanese-like domain-containing protein [Phycisphaerales bacterium]|nr:rhodanese-like domain-containing protein [Phycisphaerales bacterium]HMP36743.1 rhodanese-like domain-containing protein [Phycisphaerales bacterium]
MADDPRSRASGEPAPAAFHPPLEIGADDLITLLARPAAPVLVDVRTLAERHVAQIAPSMHIPMDQLAARLDEIGELDDPIVVYCHLGQRSLFATLFLREQGFTDVRSLAGGIDAWEKVCRLRAASSGDSTGSSPDRAT